MVWVCPTTHGSAHEVIRLMSKAGRVLSYAEVSARSDRPVARFAYRLAAQGFDAHLANLAVAGRAL